MRKSSAKYEGQQALCFESELYIEARQSTPASHELSSSWTKHIDQNNLSVRNHREYRSLILWDWNRFEYRGIVSAITLDGRDETNTWL